MKKILILISLLAGCTPKPEPVEPPHWSAVELLRNQHKEELSEWGKLILAISYTESKFKTDAVGSAQDFGCLQITPVYCSEANRVSGANFRHEDAFDIDSSLAMFEAIQSHYNKERDLDKAIYLHNKSPYYKETVLKNLELIENYELIRSKLIEYGH
jgi:Soluble lytic murein transglycosylase and related regulatory proteins (some contain LysM/invasin domains)